MNVDTSEFLYMRGELDGLLQRAGDIEAEQHMLFRSLAAVVKELLPEALPASPPRWRPAVISGGRQPGGNHGKPRLTVVGSVAQHRREAR